MGDAACVLVVEDNPDVSKVIGRALATGGYKVEIAAEPTSVVERLEAGESWDVMLLDVALPGISGIDVLRRVREAGTLTSVVMITGDQSAATATECMRAGAFHYLTKPFRQVDLITMVESARRYTHLRQQLERPYAFSGDAEGGAGMLVGTSAAIRKLRSAVSRIATQDLSVLIQGESGTGKELVARALHACGPRREHPFVALNCGAIPETLIDSELFGHARGAFTGATSDRPGVFVEANHGTLFLDEIGDMPLPVQARLLRVLQEREVRPVGGSGVREVDVRVVAATHVDLKAAVERGKFREDLFYRLEVVVMQVPPLRERVDDIPLLAAHFLRKHGHGTPPPLDPETLELLTGYAWPGNVRELENAILYALAFHTGEVIGPDALPFQIVRSRGRAAGPGRAEPEELLTFAEAKRRAMTKYERTYLNRVLEVARGSVSEGARIAGLDRTNFRRLLQRHGIDPTTFK